MGRITHGEYTKLGVDRAIFCPSHVFFGVFRAERRAGQPAPGTEVIRPPHAFEKARLRLATPQKQFPQKQFSFRPRVWQQTMRTPFCEDFKFLESLQDKSL